MKNAWLIGALSALAAGCASTAVDDRTNGEQDGPIESSSWSAPIALSAPIPPTDVVENPAVAVNASGAEVAAWDDQDASGAQLVRVRSTAGGASFSPQTTLDRGVEPAVALAPGGRAVAVWVASGGTLRASVRSPDGAWIPSVQVSPDSGRPSLGIDGAGDAIAVWASAAGVETASLPAGGTWSAVRILGVGSAPALAVNASGAAVVSWTGPGGAIMAASGTVRGSFAPAVTVAAPAYRQGGSRVALGDAGQVVVVWRGRTTDLAATRDPSGTWSAPTLIATVAGAATGAVDVAIDGAGNAVAVVQRLHTVGATVSAPLYAVRRPASSSWGPAALLSALDDTTGQPAIVADAAGSFVAAWNVGGRFRLVTVTGSPGGSFGAPVTVGSSTGGISLAIAPGHAALLWISGGATISSAPVR
jgi:hypothetical protein